LRTSKRFLDVIIVTLAILPFLSLTARGKTIATSESVLWSFDHQPDGVGPQAGLTMDTNGNLYGTTLGGGAHGEGAVFELTPPTNSGESWNESIIWSFNRGSDGNQPMGDLLIDASGNLYGTTVAGGDSGSGTVFELTPPATAGGSWTESLLHSFNGSDGSSPGGNLIMDTSGNIYGTGGGGADNMGTVFQLTPAGGGSWMESVLFSFDGTDGSGPAGLIMDSAGNLYGATEGGGANAKGTVFELTPPATIGGNWAESVLWSFDGTDGSGPAGVIMDRNGNLYSTTQGGGVGAKGTVFELTPPATTGGSWTESVLWSFGKGKDGTLPLSSLVMDTTGHLYGTTFFGGTYSDPNAAKGTPKGLGTAFELTPPSPSAGNWNESVLWSFGKGIDGYGSLGGLIIDSRGSLYGTTSQGGDPKGTSSGAGAVFEIASVLAASPTKLNLGNVVAPGTSRPKTMKLINQGTLAAQIANVTATGPFEIAGGANTCSGNTIAPKKTCTFAVEFAPTSIGKVIGGVDVTYNGTSPSLVLEGNGVAPR
jgi:uncharacterized repeat protein (TIGR03803 family)